VHSKSFLRQPLETIACCAHPHEKTLSGRDTEEIDYDFGLENRQPDLGELVADIVTPLMSLFKKIIVVLDGPDMCEPREQQEIWKQLWIIRESSSAGFNLRVATGSQDLTNILRYFPDIMQLRIDEGSNEKDIERLIEDRVISLSGRGGLFSNKSMWGEAQRLLKEKANGM
jgi:hypothetical protein